MQMQPGYCLKISSY